MSINLKNSEHDFFDIKIHSIEELKEFVNNNSDYSLEVMNGRRDIFDTSMPPPFNESNEH